MTACCVRVFLNESYEAKKYEYGVPKSTVIINLINICHPLKFICMRLFKKWMNTGEVSISKLREVIQMSVKKNRVGRPTSLILVEEAFLVVAAEIEVDHGFHIETAMIESELQCVVESVNVGPICKEIYPKSATKYYRTFVK